jgi:hypothetical protein
MAALACWIPQKSTKTKQQRVIKRVMESILKWKTILMVVRKRAVIETGCFDHR